MICHLHLKERWVKGMNKLVKTTLENLNLEFEFSDNHFTFEYLGIKMRIDEKCKISVPSEFFGKIPHVMEDGEVCVFSGIDAYIESYEDFELRETIITYIPYLFGLSPEEKVSEMLLELDFYIPAILQRNCLRKKNIDIVNFTNIEVLNPQNLWESIMLIEDEEWYKVSPVNLENEYVYIKKNKTKYLIQFDEGFKAKLRVSGNKVDLLNGKTAFIGLGAVNSYVLKKIFSMGVTDFILIDDDKVEVGNLFRYAFPYNGSYKIDAASRFMELVDSKVKIEKVYKKVVYEEETKTSDYLSNADRIIVCVDTFFSWVQVKKYVEKYAKFGCEIVFIGIDVYGNYGKFFKIKREGTVLKELFPKFLLDKNEKYERKHMVGEGCGNSLAIYDEENIMTLVNKMIESGISKDVVYVKF